MVVGAAPGCHPAAARAWCSHSEGLYVQLDPVSAQDWLRFHQEHSRPLTNGLHEWMEAQFAEHKTEPNSRELPKLVMHSQ
jgi:hypothetical protein